MNTSLNIISQQGVGDTGWAQAVEFAGRLVDRHLNYDSCFPSLFDMLKIPPQGGSSVSGFNESDYPSNDLVRHLHTVRKEPLPADLLHHFQHMQCNCMMGLFPEIKRAWLTIDSDIYVWVYEDGSDLAYFDGLRDTILSVGLVHPKQGIFKSYIEYLLCLATPTEIVLLGVSFSHPAENESVPGMHLLPESLFSLTTDGAYILTIKGSRDGRIFMGDRDGSLWELVYQAADGWFSRKCYKVNHSYSALSYLVPSFLTLSEDDPVCQVEIDDTRGIVYTLTEKGTISVYDLGKDGKSMSKVGSFSHSTLTSNALQVARTVDRANFKNLVGISPVRTSESPLIHLVVTTGTGVRLYYTTTPLNAPQSRPSVLTLLHVRLPPGFAANAMTHCPTKVHKALYTHGTAVFCASETSECDIIWTLTGDQFPYHPSLSECHFLKNVDGYVWALADVTPPLWCSSLIPPTAQGTMPPLLVTQHQQGPRQLVLLSAAGAHVLTILRPVDQLRYLLQECGGNGKQRRIRDFFQTLSPAQACATALILATDPNPQDSQVGEWARDALFLYGSMPTCAFPAATYSSTQTPTTFGYQPGQLMSPLGPMPMAAPVTSPPQQPTFTPTFVDQQYSPLHNGLYLFLARILRPVWATGLVKEITIEDKTVLTSIVSCEEVSYLGRQVDLLCKFIQNNSGPARHWNFSSSPITLTVPITSASQASFMSEGALNERSSLLAFRSLLSYTLEILRLWTVLTTHNFGLVTVNMTKEQKDQLKTVTVRDLVLSGRDVCRGLIMALMERYHGDNASIDAVSNKLREMCPNLYRVEDAKLSKANEIILAAKNTSSRVEREKAFKEAVDLCKQIGHSVNVSGVCIQLASGGWYVGVVDLCLSVANQLDPGGHALHYYKNNEPTDDPQGFIAFSARSECYRVLIEHLSQLMDTSAAPPPSTQLTVPNKPGPPTPLPQQAMPSADATQYAEQMIDLMVSSNDELAHVALYQWLLNCGRTDRLLTITSPFLEGFLTRIVPGQVNPNSEVLNNLLWRFYERNKEYYKAAKTLAMLADQVGNCPLQTRVEYLSRAVMCLSSSQMNTATSYADFMLHLEEKKDVAKVQLMVLDACQSGGCGADVISALNGSLLDITTLYEKFAEPWQLWEGKLAIVHCAGHSEPQLIHSLWTHIIEEELSRTSAAGVSSQTEALSAKIVNLARVYCNSPNYFPLEHVIKTCEIYSVRLKAEATSWVIKALQDCGVSLTRLVHIYNKLYQQNRSLFEVERSSFHLLKGLCHLFTSVCAAMKGTGSDSQEKRALREQCLDYIASYLTDLSSSPEPSSAIIASHLKTCQINLERV